METHRLVITEDLNQYGNLFGGRLLSWVDEASFIGAIIIIRSTRVKVGRTSVRYLVQVFKNQCSEDHVIFETTVTFVNVGENGEKREIEQ